MTLRGSRGLTAIDGSASEFSVGSPGKLHPCGKGVAPDTICASSTRAGSPAAWPAPGIATSAPANTRTLAARLTAARVAKAPAPRRPFELRGPSAWPREAQWAREHGPSPSQPGLDARTVLRPRLRVHDHAADDRARQGADVARAGAGRAHAGRDLLDVRRLRVADQRRRTRSGEPAAAAARRHGGVPDPR